MNERRSPGSRSRLPIIAAVALVVFALGLGGVAAAEPVPGGTLDPTTIPKYDPAGDTAGHAGDASPTTTRSRCSSSSSRSCRRPCPRRPCGATALSTTPGPSTTRPSPSRPGRPADEGQVDQRAGGRERQLPAAPAARRPDAALGQSGGRDRGPGPRRDDVRSRTPARCPSSPTCTAPTSARRATATPRPGGCRRPTTSRPGYATRGSHWDQIAGVADRARRGDLPVPQRPAGGHPLVPRPHPGHDPAERVRGTGRLLPAARRRQRPGRRACCPGPAPQLGDAAGTKYYEIPIAIQDRSFNADGSLFYPGHRAFFEGLSLPESAGHPLHARPGRTTGRATCPPIWNPEFFGNTMVVNGKTWPYLEVEPRRYRLRLLNGCDSRGSSSSRPTCRCPFWQIGADRGFLPAAGAS